MTWRRAGSSLIVLVLVLGISGCKGGESTGPGGGFGIGTGPFVTTGGASQADPEEITFIVDLFTQRMSFNAKGPPENANGVFNFTGKVFGEEQHIHGNILCYRIDGNKARVGGVITNSDQPDLLGKEAAWTVEDNGEGSNPLLRDKISVYSTDPTPNPPPGWAQLNCNTPFGISDLTTYPIETGNVQVHP
jgi:hypothetical protein